MSTQNGIGQPNGYQSGVTLTPQRNHNAPALGAPAKQPVVARTLRLTETANCLVMELAYAEGLTVNAMIEQLIRRASRERK